MDGSDRAENRGVVEVSGPDSRSLLQRLLTNDVEDLAAGEARYAALLTPQGKVLVDFFVLSAPLEDGSDRFLFDVPPGFGADLAKRLTMYRLRAKVTIQDRSDALTAAAVGDAARGGEGIHLYRDPRHADLGPRAIGPIEAIAAWRPAAEATHGRRIAAGVPEGGVDFPYGDVFPHEANLDRLHGVNFRKGCYVGQEVVSRMEHRSTARKRIAPVTADAPLPPPGTAILTGDLPIGTMGSSVGPHGLALVRLDRAGEAQAAGTAITAGGLPIRINVSEPT